MRRIFVVICSSCMMLNACTLSEGDLLPMKEEGAPDQRPLTLTEELLEQERISYSVLTNVDDPNLHAEIRARYDDIVDDALIAFDEQQIDIAKAHVDEDEAIRALKTIETVLVENHFLLHIHTYRLHEMLTPQPARRQRLYSQERIDFYYAHQDDLFYHFDCDLGSLVFLGIGERMGLPIKFVEVPGHNFVRWRFEDGSYINWDTNTARTVTDDQFRRGESLSASASFDRDAEERAGYLRDMSRDEIKGYYFGLIGSRMSKSDEVREAARIFEEGIRLSPYGTTPANNYSWMLVTREEFEGVEFANKAVSLSRRVFEIEPNDRGSNDTYACALAAAGNIDEAIRMERLAYNRDDKIKAFSEGRTCLDMVRSGELEV